MQAVTRTQAACRRRYELDWLRVLTIGVMFFFHSARFFDKDGWHVKNAETSPVATLFVTLTVQWMMPLFFLISGASVWLALQQRATSSFLKERVLRLLVPFVFGTLVLIPPQVYLERLSHGQFSGSFPAFYPHYFEGWYGFGGNFAWMGLHLWYLEFLFLFSLLMLPLFVGLKRLSVSPGFASISGTVSRPWVLCVLPVPIALLEIVLDPRGPGRRDFGGWNLFAYLVVFSLGFLLYSHGLYRDRIRRWRWLFLLLALSSLAVLLNWHLHGDLKEHRWVQDGLRGFHSWFWLLTILSFALEHLAWPPSWLSRANELVMPFYVLHQSVILVIGYFVIALPLSSSVKYLLICLGAGTVILLLCAIIWRIPVLRFLFGMRSRRTGSRA